MLVVMKRVEVDRITAGDRPIDERYIVEMFDDVRRNGPPVALGYARFRPHDGACSVNIVSRGGVRDDDHARAALAALRRIVDAAGRDAGRPAADVSSRVAGPSAEAAGDAAARDSARAT